MTAAMIASLLIQFGPPAIQLIQQLVAVWNTPSLSVDQVNTICVTAQKSYDDYIAQAKAKLGV
jgi:hypothetical protein